jgi:sodium-coupled monocarboxylate transporter 8/12
MFTYVSLYAINQTQVQRYLTMKDYRTAVKSLWCSLPLLSLLSISTCFSGLAMFSKYYNCDPIKYIIILFKFGRKNCNLGIF